MLIYLSSGIASLHYLALAMGLGSLFMRGRYFRALEKSWDDATLKSLFAADSFWGIAALLWIGTGLARAFGGLEKGSGFYLHHRLFWLKMGLFLLVFLIELRPMFTLLRWRNAQRRGGTYSGQSQLGSFIRSNDVEVVLVVSIVFVASAMARGIGF